MKKIGIMKRLAALSTVCVLSAVFLIGCSFGSSGEETETEEDNSIEVRAQNPQVKDIAISANFSATVVAESEVKVIPLVTGEVVEKNFEVGDHVNAGETLFRIDDETYQIALRQAEASVTTAQAGLTSAKASLNQSEANANTTRAQAIQQVGEIPYNEASQNYNVDAAYVAKRNSHNTWGNADDAVDTAKTNLDDYKRARDAAESALKTAKASGASADEIARLQEVYDTAESRVDTAEDALDSARRNADSAEMNYYLSRESYGLTEMQRDNYNTYTKATTLYGAYASAVGADSSVTSSRANVTSSAANVQSAQAGLENAQLNLEHTNVKAPVSGTITAIDVTLHNMVTQQGAAYTIQSDEPCKVVFYVAEETARCIVPGTEAIVTKNGVDYTAKIITVYDTIDSGTGLFRVEAGVPGKGAENLIAGSSVSIRTVTRKADNALTVPIDSVYYDGEQAFLYVAEGGRARRVNVATGLSDDTAVEILDGIGPQDKVVVTWSGSLRDGSELRMQGASDAMTAPSEGATSTESDPSSSDGPQADKASARNTESMIRIDDGTGYTAGAGDIE
ncbi:MAG: efflux RND transporter periplasmic adaptor subunit [Lachnospiraceae bacterium]|nr:efflux RND transporter periplasmic adaptor subunit [Lachnospiraceae bacterium]